jgi:hypothetical protein
VTAIVIFMGLCVAGMLVLVGFLVAWFKESTAMGGSYLLMLGQQQNESSEARSTASSAMGKASARAA